jgi:hypothetical protein
MKVAYGKFTRSWNSERGKASTVGGDIDVWRLLQRLAKRRPQHEYVLVGRHQGGIGEFPSNVSTIWDDRMNTVKLADGTVTLQNYNDFMDTWCAVTDPVEVDSCVFWLGQVGNANSPIPMIGTDWSDNKLANPYVMNVRYTAPLCDFVNRRGIDPILLTPDPRNWWRPREIWRPFKRPVLGQYNMVKDTKHEQYDHWGQPWQVGYPREESVIVAQAEYAYAGIEYTALDEPEQIAFSEDYDRPHHIGIISNENKKEVPDAVSRLVQLKEWVLSLNPDTPVHGSWSEESRADLKREISSVPLEMMQPTLRTFRATVTFPASGSGWVTAKWAEAASAGTVCFIHPGYDDQDHIFRHADKLKYRELKKFLRVYTPRQLKTNLAALERDRSLWLAIITMQRELFLENFNRWEGGAKCVIEQLDADEARLSL